MMLNIVIFSIALLTNLPTIAGLNCSRSKSAKTPIKKHKVAPIMVSITPKLDQKSDILPYPNPEVSNLESNILRQAASLNNIEAIQKLLDEGCLIDDQDENGFTALHHAAKCGHRASVELLLSHGADCTIKDFSGQDAMYWAILIRAYELIPLLKGAGGDVNQKNSNNLPSMYVAGIFDEKLIQVLLDNGLNVNLTGGKYNTSLVQRAAYCGVTDVVELLLDAGAYQLGEDLRFGSLLHWAAFGGSFDVIIDLVTRGANVNLVNLDGKRPIDIAKERKHEAIVLFLERVSQIIDHANSEFPIQ